MQSMRWSFEISLQAFISLCYTLTTFFKVVTGLYSIIKNRDKQQTDVVMFNLSFLNRFVAW